MTHLAELTARHGLDAGQRRLLEALLDRVAQDEHVPTAIRDRQRIIDAHLADSLSALVLAEVREARTLADIGSGAGFPGLALAIVLPACHVWLVESVGRKCRFLDGAVEQLGLANVAVTNTRVEEWAAGEVDVVTARALAAPPVVVEYAAPLLRVGGALVEWRAGQEPPAERAAALVGLEHRERHRTAPFEGARDLYLDVYVKVRPTPGRFPRRPGLARRRPLA